MEVGDSMIVEERSLIGAYWNENEVEGGEKPMLKYKCTERCVLKVYKTVIKKMCEKFD